MDDDKLPTAGSYKGVALHAGQSARRLDVVRQDLDAVLATMEAGRLFEIAGDSQFAPEARLLAEARCKALFELAAENRIVRPDVDLDRLAAMTAGLNSKRWIDPSHHSSLLDQRLGVPRERPLEND